MGGIQGLIFTSARSLDVQSKALRLTGNNISNVDTPGYATRRLELSSTGISGDDAPYGLGAQINRVSRSVDSYVEKELQARLGDQAAATAVDDILSRTEAIFSVDGNSKTIGSALSDFFSSLNDLTTSPADIPIRQRVIQAADTLSTTIRNAYSGLAQLQREADNRAEASVNDINRLTTSIAKINSQIAASETVDQENLGLRDQRDELLKDLSKKITFSALDNGDGTISLSLSSGFSLVTGAQSKDLTFDRSPSFAPTGGFPAGLDGSPLGHVVYDYDPTAGESQANFTGLLSAQGGELGGLLKVRGIQATTDTNIFQASGSIISAAARVESISRDLLTRFNQTYRGAPNDEDTVTANFQASSGDLNGATPGVFGLFTFNGAVDNGDGLATTADLTAVGLPNYSSILNTTVTDPANFAAARDINATAAATLFASGDGSNAQALLDLRDDVVNYSLGTFTSATTIEGVYEGSVSYIGGIRSQSRADKDFTDARATQAEELSSSISGVSLDEEFAKLIQYQKTFQASARMIKIGDQLLDEIIGLIR
jgi:flagellar hook-associated protein 1